MIDDLELSQAEDGYLNCWYLQREPEKRWTNLRDNHEMYNAGHLLEGAVAYFQATGRDRFLNVMERFTDHIAATFGAEEGKRRGYPGHQELELALIRAWHATGKRKFLDLATYFIDERGTPERRRALLRHRGEGARRAAGGLLVRRLRIQPVPYPRPRTDEGRRSRRPGDVHVRRHGRPRRRAWRRRAEARL